MIYAYLRVSTVLQDEENQRVGVDNYAKRQGLKIQKYIIDKVSGTKDPNRRNLGKLLKKLKAGDTLIISEISRLSRKLFDITTIINDFLNRNIHLHTVKENFDLGDNIQSKVIVFAFGLSAEIERTLLSERTRESLALCKARGQKLGRPVGAKTRHHKLDPYKVRLVHDYLKGVSISHLARRYKCANKTIKKYAEAHKNDKEI